MSQGIERAKAILAVLGERKILFIFVVVLATVTSALAAYQGWIDSGFPYMNVADSELVNRLGRITVNPFLVGSSSCQNNVANVRSSRFEVILVPVFLSQVMGISVSSLTFFPLTGIVLPIIGYLLAKTLLSSDIWGFVFGTYLALEPQALLRDYNTNIQGYGQIFFLLTVYAISTYFLVKSERRYVSLAVITFATAIMSYYSSEFYALAFAIVMILLLYVKRVYPSQRRFLMSVTLIFLIFTLTFEPIVGPYVEKLSAGEGRNMISIFARFVSDILRVVGIRGGRESTASVISTPPNLLVLNGALLILIFVPLIAVLVPLLLRGKKYTDLFFVSIVVTGLLDFTAYSALEGHIDLKFFYTLFPLCSMVAIVGLSTVRKTRILMISKVFFILGILILVSFRFGLYATGPYSSISKLHTQQLDEFETIVAQSGSSKVYLTDNVAAGKLLVSFAKSGPYGSVAVYQYPSVGGISFLYSGNASDLVDLSAGLDRLPDYLLVTRYSLKSSFPAQGWSSFPPFSNFTRVLNSTNLATCYMGQDAIILEVNYPGV